MTAKRTSLKPTSKEAWAKANDRGPHVATFPSGAVLEFVIADSGALLRSGKLPEPLRITGTLASAHEGGADGYMADLVQTAIFRGGDAQATIAGAVAQGVELSHFLVAEMLVAPDVTPEEVASGMFHELDIRMLLGFAERRLNVDAAGKQLPIMLVDADFWTRFRREPGGDAGTRAGGENGTAVPGDVPQPDGGAL